MKPEPETDAKVLTEFDQTVQKYEEVLAKIKSLRTPTRHDHPWFGSLHGQGWHCMAALHHTIHRRQIEKIIAGLNER